MKTPRQARLSQPGNISVYGQFGDTLGAVVATSVAMIPTQREPQAGLLACAT